MLLRSVTEHVRQQNWTAIVIDFLIVVVGVFIGIQVANWNETLKSERDEALLIARLSVDFQRIEQDARRSLEYHQQMLSDLKSLARSLRDRSLAEEDRPAVDRVLLLGLSLQTSADRSGTFTELLSSGRADLLRDKALLNELVAYEDFLERFDVGKEYLLGLMLGNQQAFMAGFGYDFDEPFLDEKLRFEHATMPTVTYDFDSLVANEPFHEAVEQLSFLHNVAIVWRSRISARISRIRDRLRETSSA